MNLNELGYFLSLLVSSEHGQALGFDQQECGTVSGMLKGPFDQINCLEMDRSMKSRDAINSSECAKFTFLWSPALKAWSHDS